MEHLLSPVSDSAPCGEYLKGNRTLYRGLRNTFNMAQSSFRQLIESPDATADEALVDANLSNWRTLAGQCEQTLTDTSKDVEVFCWLATAQLFTPAPFENLAAVLGAFADCIGTYWADLNPKPPEEKLSATDEAGRRAEWAENRIRPLLQLVGDTRDSGLLYMPLQMIPLIGAIDYGRYYAAEKKGELPQLKAEAQQAFMSEKARVTEVILALGRILDGLERLETGIAEQCRQDGVTAPSFRYVKESIERLLGALRVLVGDSLTPWPLDKAAPAPAPAAVAEPAAATEVAPAVAAAEAVPVAAASVPEAMVNLAATGEIYHRDQAFQQLRNIADYFRRTEPHSPVSMLLERAIRWGYMSLPELLSEMVGDNGAVMARITQLAGLESVEQTEIPAAQISAQELLHRQQAASSSAAAPAAAVNLPVEPVVAPEPAAPASEPQASDSGISSFEW